MKRTPIPSDFISAIGYAPCASVLEIEFADGTINQYLEIPTSVFDALMASLAHETFFRELIEPHYNVRQLGLNLEKSHS
jgi:hypothetical protein